MNYFEQEAYEGISQNALVHTAVPLSENWLLGYQAPHPKARGSPWKVRKATDTLQSWYETFPFHPGQRSKRTARIVKVSNWISHPKRLPGKSRAAWNKRWKGDAVTGCWVCPQLGHWDLPLPRQWTGPCWSHSNLPKPQALGQSLIFASSTLLLLPLFPLKWQQAPFQFPFSHTYCVSTELLLSGKGSDS